MNTENQTKYLYVTLARSSNVSQPSFSKGALQPSPPLRSSSYINTAAAAASAPGLVEIGKGPEVAHSAQGALPHLVGSVFYTDSDKLGLVRGKLGNIQYLLVFRVVKQKMIGITINHESENLVEVSVSVFDLFHLFDKIRADEEQRDLTSLIQDYTDDLAPDLKRNREYPINVIFIFEDLNWFTVQLLFRFARIEVSGGTISSRHTLSTVHFLLSKVLIFLGYNTSDIYLSNIHSRKQTKAPLNLSVSLEQKWIIAVILNEKPILLQKLEERNKVLNNLISTKKGNLLFLEEKKSLLKSAKLKIKKDKQIGDLKIQIQNLEGELNVILATEFKYNETYSEKNLNSLPFEELKNIYYKEFHSLRILNIKSELSKTLSNFSLVKSKSGKRR